MATSTTINGTAYSSFEGAFGATASSPTAGVYTALPPYGNPPQINHAEYEEILVTYPGVDGVGTKNNGWRGRDCMVDLIICGATPSAVMTSYNTLVAGFVPTTRFSITLPGDSAIAGWKLKRNSAKLSDPFTIGTAICRKVSLEFREYSTSN